MSDIKIVSNVVQQFMTQFWVPYLFVILGTIQWEFNYICSSLWYGFFHYAQKCTLFPYLLNHLLSITFRASHWSHRRPWEMSAWSGGTSRVHPPPPPSRGGPYLPGLVTKNAIATPVPSSGVPGWGVKPVQPPGSLFAPPCTGHNCDPGGG